MENIDKLYKKDGSELEIQDTVARNKITVLEGSIDETASQLSSQIANIEKELNGLNALIGAGVE